MHHTVLKLFVLDSEQRWADHAGTSSGQIISIGKQQQPSGQIIPSG